MPVTTEQMYVVFQSIDASLKLLVAHFGAGAPNQATAPTAGRAIPHIASDRDLDGDYGDPEVRATDPRDWTGDVMRGRRFSECPPEYLDLLAERFDYFAEKADVEGKTTSSGKPVAPYNRKDAARARGWAARLRAGWKPEESDDTTSSGFPSDNGNAPLTDDDISF